MNRIISIIASLLIAYGCVYSQDITRKGFIVGVSLGGGLVDYHVNGSFTGLADDQQLLINNQEFIPLRFYRDDTAAYPYNTTSGAIYTNFNIGYAFTNRLVVLYTNRVAWMLDSHVE